MTYQVKIILSPNLNESYLQADFLNNGDTYFTGVVNNNIPALDTNATTITFGIQLIDVDTRQPVVLKTIEWIKLSNDPNFDPTATITISSWPYDDTDSNGAHYVTGQNLDYFLQLNPLYFFDPGGYPLEASPRTTAVGTGIFTISGWPLSANGGLSSVFFQILVKSITGEKETYPDGYGLYDQIFWQSEQSLRPGVPVAATAADGFVGRKALWRFRASEEPSTGLYDTGIARYRGDIIELRLTQDKSAYALYSTEGASTSGNKRTFAPTIPAHALSTTVFSHIPSTNVFSAPSAGAMGTTSILTTDTGLAYYSNSVMSTYADQPDFAAQSHVQFTLNDNASLGNVSIRSFSKDEATNSGICDEVQVTVVIDANNPPIATLRRIINGVVWNGYSQTTPLLPSIVADLAAGGVLELYTSPLTRSGDPVIFTFVPVPSPIDNDNNSSINAMIVEAYFTPDSDPENSYLLASDIVPVWTTSDPLSVDVMASCIAGSVTFMIDEIAFGTGRFLLDVDLGDCFTDAHSEADFPTTYTSASLWSSALANGTWLPFAENSISPSATGGGLSLSAPTNPTKRAVCEVQAVMPTFSDRAGVDFIVQHTTGEFYVAFSSVPVYPVDLVHTPSYTPRPMGTRCDPEYALTNEPLRKPTILVSFSQSNNTISIVQRRPDNTLTSKTVMPYSPNGTDSWSILVSSISPEGTADGTWIVLKRGLEVVGHTRLESELLSSVEGMGLYVAVGVRADGPRAFTVATIGGNSLQSSPRQAGEAVLQTVKIYGLPPIAPAHMGDAISQRHFVKSTGGSVYQQALLGQVLLAGNTDRGNFDYSAYDAQDVYFTQLITVDQISSFFTSIYAQLLEVSMHSTYEPIAGDTFPPLPQVRFYADNAGLIDTPLSDWQFGTQPTTITPGSAGYLVPQNALVQFGLSSVGSPEITATTPFWVAIRVPKQCQIAAANGHDPSKTTEIFYSFGGGLLDGVLLDISSVPIPGTGWLVVKNLYFKLFADYRQRHDNIYDKAVLQMRTRAESHARLSSQPSGLSNLIKVDISAPQHLSTGRPSAILALPASVRSAMLYIEAADPDSGLLAFRIGSETDYGTVVYTEWQPWSVYFINTGVNYTIYNYGTWPLTPTGSIDIYTDGERDVDGNLLMVAQNMGNDGPRLIWVQVMDKVGNVSESFPITVSAQPIALVDTTAPSSHITFADPMTSSNVTLTNQTTGWLKITPSDRITAVKDARIRKVGSNVWPPYQQINDFSSELLTQNEITPTDGLKRFEIQVRDYGNNSQQAGPQWDMLLPGMIEIDDTLVPRGVMFNSACVWTPPGHTEPITYLAGVQSCAFTSMSLVDAQDPAYSGGVAFYAISQQIGSVGRVVLVRNTDVLDLLVNSVLWTRWTPISMSNPCSGAPPNSYWIDNDRGLIVFCGGAPIGAIMSVNINRTSAQIWKWDSNTIQRVADLGYLGELIILSMCPTPSQLLLGGSTGNLWTFDGNGVTGPLFSAVDLSGNPLVISLVAMHQFRHEIEPYIYVGTLRNARLFRARLDLLQTANAWSAVAVTGDLTGSVAVDITCATSAYDSLFIGTNQGKIYRYSRTLNRTNLTTETEHLDVSVLKPSHINDLDNTILPVSSLLTISNAVIAAIGDRPEVFTYVETLSPLPQLANKWVDGINALRLAENWSGQYFGAAFIQDCAPWQFYSNGATNARNNPLIYANSVTDPYTESGFKEILTVVGKSGFMTTFTAETGSDFEQAIDTQTIWMLEMDMQWISGTGSQGFQISDGRYFLDVSLTNVGLKLQSGTNIVAASFFNSDNIVSAFQQGGEVYPENGILKLWNFDLLTSDENSGPALIGDDANATGTTQGWTALAFVNSIAVGSYTNDNSGTISEKAHYITIHPTDTGNPRIGVLGLAPFQIDSHIKCLVRMRIQPAAYQVLDTVKVRMAFSDQQSSNYVDYEFVDLPLAQTSDFHTYVFSPSLSGLVRSIVLEIDGLSNTEARPLIDIDYVAIASTSHSAIIHDNLTPIRVGITDRRVQVWVGKTEEALIDQDNFLSLPATFTQIRWGKTDINQADSTWNWGGIKFLPGTVYAPMFKDIQDFRMTWRFPSAGGVRSVINHRGTAWALTDGISAMKIADNPDDRAMKAFSFIPQKEVWQSEAPPPLRLDNGTGVIRPFVAVSYNDTLVVAGQRGFILY